MRVIALNPKQDFSIGIFRQKDVALFKQRRVVRDEVGVSTARQTELPAKLLRPAAQLTQRNLHLTLCNQTVLKGRLNDRASNQPLSIQSGVRVAQRFDLHPETEADSQIRSSNTLR